MPVALLALSLAACGGGGAGDNPTAFYALSVQKSGGGSGTVTGGGISCGATCSTSLAAGTLVTLTASADAGSTFAGWVGCDSTSGATCNVTMDADCTVTATFNSTAPVRYTLSVQKSGGGSGTVTGGGGAISCGATCSASLDSGTAVTLTAAADAGSTFASWSGCDTTAGATCNVTMNANRTVTATFNSTAPVQYTLSVQKSGGGSGTVTGGGISCGATCSASLAAGTAVTLTAAADAGSTFSSWSGCDTTAGATCNVTMNANRTVTATFDAGAGSLHVVNSTSYTIRDLHVSPAGDGTWGSSRLASPIVPGGTFTLTDIPAGAYDFRAVASDGISYWQTNSVSITAGGLVTWTLLPPDAGSLEVVNNHCIALDQLYVRPSSSSTWAPNQLASPVAPGGTFTLTGIPVGTYDVWAVALDGLSWTTYGIAVTVGGTSTWPVYMPAGTGCLTIVNNTPDTIDYLFDPSSPLGCTSNLWGTEQLQGYQILPDTTFTLSNIPQGTHDFWARSFASAVDYRVCGMGIPAGGTFIWYLIFPL